MTMKLFSSAYNNLRMVAFAILMLFGLLGAVEMMAQIPAPYLVKAASQVEGLPDALDLTFDPTDNTQTEAKLLKDAYFTVKLENPITLTDTEGLVVLFGRWSNEGSPKATLVKGSVDGTTWDTLGYSYMQFRGGNGTIEYSKRIYANETSKDKAYTQLRFTVLKTALGYADDGGQDYVRFNKFNVFLLKDGELYPDGRIDPWRLSTDYYTSYKDYKFEPTSGILSHRNHYGKNKDYPTETPWGDNNTFTYEGREYELPTFHMQGDNQMPHVTEHTVYVMPGEIIPLLPYYDMPRNYRYHESFSHWYKYNTDINGVPQTQDYSHVIDKATGERLLDFLIDPAGVSISDKAGYFGGGKLPQLSGQYVIRNISDLKYFSELVNDGQTDLNAILAADIDLGNTEVTIGTSTNPYKGTFNGNGHTISKLYISSDGTDDQGFFKNVAVGASVKNLKIENCNIKNKGNTGILIGKIADGSWGSTEVVKVNNVLISGDIEIDGDGYGGAVVGLVGDAASLEIRNLGFIGSVKTNAESAALVGNTNQYSSTQIALENCYADAFVQKIKVDGNNSCAAVKVTQEKLTIKNCIFNIRSLSSVNENINVYVSQTGDGVENCGYMCSFETKRASDNDGTIKIYVEKGNWSDFILYFIRNSWDSSMPPKVGCDGFVNIDGIEYGYFEYKGYDYFGYGIIPYNGEISLKDESFSWDIPGIGSACDVDKEQKQHFENDEYVKISAKDFLQTIEENHIFAQWNTSGNHYPVPPMSHVDDGTLQSNLDSDKKFLSHTDEVIDQFRHSWYGTVATFFKPLDPSKAPDDDDNLKLGAHSFDIAADFSHEFDPSDDRNLDEDGKVIYSPIINFRHIFHVVSGKDFADENTSSTESNKKYLVGKRRIVSARAGVNFQVRLPSEFPVPTEDNIYSSTNFYYRSGANSYDRARAFGIEVIKDGQEISGDKFYFERNPQSEGGPNSSQGTRQYYENGPTYYTAGGNGVVHRMLQCDNPEEGTYTVRLYALDDESNPVHIWDDPSSKIYMMEYVITFLDGVDASFTIESNIPELHQDSYLVQEDVCGEPVVFLDFDQYKAFENTALYTPDDYFIYDNENNHDLKSFKWPSFWSQCSYSFGYAGYKDYNYNEYMIANHASQVLWGESAKGYNKNPDGSTGLYDRLYYDTDGKEKGFFYYVNAASDPGVTSKLRIERLCLGSTVVVTGWVSEFSPQSEVANVAFNFSAVMRDGSRLRLHTFVTGYIEGRPEWHHVYYSFVPVLPETVKVSEIDHYELEVENNCKSSQGADYAVDDIRAYIVTPEITATQLAPVCDKEVATTGIRLRTRFDKLLNSQGIVVADDESDAEDCMLYVAMFDKDIFDKVYADAEKKIEDALNESLIMQQKEDGTTAQWIGMPLSNLFSNLPEYKTSDTNIEYYKVMGYKSVRGVEYLVANIQPYDEDMHAGKQYYVSTYLVDKVTAQEPTLIDFAVSDDACAKYGIITLQGSGIVKVDGFAYTNEDTIEVCLGQTPVVQVELMMIDEQNKTKVSEEKYYYDWYIGGLDEFSSSIYQPLTKFRLMFPDATSIPTVNREDPMFESMTDDEYDAAVAEFATLAWNVNQGFLLLHQSSYVFPTIKSGDLDGDNQLVVTAMPIITDQKEEGLQVCAGPNEIRLTVKDASPLMKDGFETINYPSDLSDVPLRVGLRQLRDVSTSVTNIPEDFTRYLEVPLRAITSYKGDGQSAEMLTTIRENETDPYIYIVESNDPLYKSLISHPGTELVDPSLKLTSKNDYGVVEGLLAVGKLTGLTAVRGGEANAVKIVFSKDMQFREGYYYRLRFDFKEKLAEDTEEPCDGQVVFTIKVVPEYQQWTGSASRNWNNDANWKRVEKSDLFLGDTDTEIGTEKVAAADHTADKSGNNNNILSYAPLDFTKVIIPAAVDRFPVMFERNKTAVQTLHESLNWDEKDSDKETGNHAATKNIKYDMASLSLTSVLACRPWYANTCDEIHFQYGAELLRQQYFVNGDNYQKAWVDLEIEPNRWYTLATPLQQVVAGDMYTISAGSKQNTELFRDITFNNDEYGRFQPAVYQRSWNKDSKAEVYTFGDGTNASSDAADGISLNWSRVYNQVDVNYSGGEGFSINTRAKADDNTDGVRFRLPKADTMYSYFKADDDTEEADDKQIGVRENRHKLNVFPMKTTLTAKESSRYFLVGNPFIARMDMKKFFEGNPDLTGKYWIMSGNRQMAYLWNGAGSKFITTSVADGDTGEEVAPMQGFFVEANNPLSSLTVNFTEAMIKETDGAGNAGPLKAKQREDADAMLTLSAIVDGEVASRAVINLVPSADAAYDDSEDAAMLIDPSLKAKTAVYTVAAGKALAINSLDRITETEIGVAASPEVKTTLLFEGVDAAGDVKLLDTAKGEFAELYEGMTYEVEGNAAGRLYLVDSEMEIGGSDIALVLQGRRVSVVSSNEGVSARAFDTVGVCLGEWESGSHSLSFDLPQGIMLIEARSNGKRVTRKFVVR